MIYSLKKLIMKRKFITPTVLNVELTEVCNVKCTHCYNFWRDESMGEVSLDTKRFDKIVEKAIEAKVFHVILTGGEPMAKFPILEHGLKNYLKIIFHSVVTQT